MGRGVHHDDIGARRQGILDAVGLRNGDSGSGGDIGLGTHDAAQGEDLSRRQLGIGDLLRAEHLGLPELGACPGNCC